MYDLEIYAKYREREIKESLNRSEYKTFHSQRPNRLTQTMGNMLTLVGGVLSKFGQKLINEPTDTEMRHSPVSVR